VLEVLYVQSSDGAVAMLCQYRILLKGVTESRAVDHAFSRWSACRVEARGDRDAGLCGIYGGINCNGRRFFPEYLGFP
jgi:hypothetical protein